MLVDVALSAQEITNFEIQDKSVVVIDVLRSTSTMLTALVNGCTAVIPVKEPEEAWALAAEEKALLGGERKCLKIPGFDLGNSPLEYRPEVVAGKKLILCTTNGTLALVNSRGARVLAIGALLNGRAVAGFLAQQGNPVLLACAGTRGEFALEDFLAAGLIIQELQRIWPGLKLSDKALAAQALYSVHARDLYQALLLGRNGRHLTELGFGADVAYCARTNLYQGVPIYQEGRIILP